MLSLDSVCSCVSQIMKTQLYRFTSNFHSKVGVLVEHGTDLIFLNDPQPFVEIFLMI